MIGILDYGLGNILAFKNIYKKLNVPAKIITEVSDLDGVTKLILPGVGAFDHAMTLFNNSGLREKVEKLVLDQHVPILGICVGLQILFLSSEEGEMPGLGWLEGHVKKILVAKDQQFQALPHMGWNSVVQVKENPIFNDISQGSPFYFLHSYYVVVEDSTLIVATADYTDSFACVVNDKNIYGVQCHPEKSHDVGIQFLKNFAGLG
jgi:glutamine amidotransferase